MVVGGCAGDSFEMRVVGPNGVLPELQHPSGTYVVASPGEKFTVQVRNRQRKPALAKASLTVDGKDAGYSKKIVGCMTWNLFDGFWVNPTERRAFVFSSPSEALEGTEPNSAKRVGIIRVKLVPAEYYPCPGKNCVRCQFLGHETQGQEGYAATKETESVLRPDGKKFFMAPSLCVAAGQPMERRVGEKRVQHTKEVPGALPSVLEVRCEQADILRLRGVLDPKNVAHARLLPAFVRNLLCIKLPEEETPGTEEDATQAATSSSHDGSGVAKQASGATAAEKVRPEAATPKDSRIKGSIAPSSPSNSTDAAVVAERSSINRGGGTSTPVMKREREAPSPRLPPQKAPKSSRLSTRQRGEGSHGIDKEGRDAARPKARLVDLNLATEEGDDECAVLVIKKPEPEYVDC